MAAIEITYDGSVRVLQVPEAGLVMPRRSRSDSQAKDSGNWPVLGQAIESCNRLLVVINDASRPTPTTAVLERLRSHLESAGEVRVVVATGMHPPPDDAWLDAALGDVLERRGIHVHDASQPGHRFDTPGGGAALMLNPMLDWAERILLIGSVEPHFFAGFTGGAKQILPGLATRDTIEANHRHATDIACQPMRLEGNPGAAGIRQAALCFADRLLSVQATMGPKGWEYFCGTEPDTFERAAARCTERACIRWPEPLDAMVAVVEPPLDQNLYQLQKGFENHRGVVHAGGRMLLMSACRDGVGNSFFGPLADRYPDWRQLPPWEDQTYSLGLHKLYRTAQLRRTVHLDLFSSLPDREVRRFYLEPVDDPDRWIRMIIDAGKRIGVVRDAGNAVSVLDANE